MLGAREDFVRQMRRQSSWLEESLLWILDTRVLSRMPGTGTVTALDVGCGPGSTVQIMRRRMEVKGVDIDPEMVEECRSLGIDASVAPGERLPFGDGSFDFVYCTFLLLWVKDPVKIVSEMRRVSRHWVACLAEPDFGGRISHPKELAALDEAVIEGIRRDGGDPLMGRKLREVFAGCGMEPEIGLHPGVWGIDRLREESADEWRWADMTVEGGTHKAGLETARRAWDTALRDGKLFQFNPIFYALAEK